MADWALVVPARRYASERLFHHEGIELADLAPVPVPGDRVALLAAAEEPVVFALGRVRESAPPADTDPDDPQARDPGAAGEPGVLRIGYTHRFFDQPVSARELIGGEAARELMGGEPAGAPGTAHPLPDGVWDALADRIDPVFRVDGVKRTWLVSLDLPIEAGTPAEAVRVFWSYVRELGPRELPAFVSPSGDELAMQAFVLGSQTNLDPEEDE